MDLSKNALHQRLRDYDGKQTQTLVAIAQDFATQDTYIDQLIALAEEHPSSLAEGATWLIKHHLENSGPMSAPQIHKLMASAARYETWAAQLHLCQIIPDVALTPEDARKTAGWLTPLLTHKRPFLRAWSLTALVALANAHEDLAEKARTALNKAGQDPAASVRARVKKLSV